MNNKRFAQQNKSNKNRGERRNVITDKRDNNGKIAIIIILFYYYCYELLLLKYGQKASSRKHISNPKQTE